MAGDTLHDSVTLLLSFDGSHGSTTMVDTSVNPKTIYPFGNGKLSTADKKWGTASLEVDESTDQKKDKLIKPVTDKSEGDAIPAALEEATVPKITVEQGSVKADGKFIDMKFERVGSKMFLMIGDPKNGRERMAVPADQASYPGYIEWLKANWGKANDLLATLGESKEQDDDAMLYEFTGGGVVVDKSGAVKKDGKPVALKFEKHKGKLWLLVGDGDGDQDRLEVPDAQSGDMAAAVDWLVMSWKTVMKILATNNMQESIEQPA